MRHSKREVCLTPLRAAYPWGGRLLPILSLVLTAAFPSWAGEAVLFQEDFESEAAQDNWVLSGDWRFKTNSACLPNELGYTSPTTALVFDYGSECGYRNKRSGFAGMTTDVLIPVSVPSATLEWWDFAGAEQGSDYYFVQLSTDGGITWPYELYRDSIDETFWDQETVDLTPFTGERIRLRFGFTSDETITNFGWYIDDIRIVGETLAEGVSAVAVSDASANEGDGLIAFRLSIVPPNDNSITLDHNTVSRSATAGLDFVASSGPVTIPAGADSATIAITVIDDVLFERDESLQLEISAPSSNASITLSAATGVIHDNEQLTCLYDEDFEQRPGTFRWTVQQPDAEFATTDPNAGLWHIARSSTCASPAYASPVSALVFTDETRCTYDTQGGVDGWVAMTEDIYLVDQTSGEAEDVLAAQVSFMHLFEAAYPAARDECTTGYVEISNDGGQSWAVGATFRPDAPSPQPFLIPWREEVINLDSYIGQNVRLRFRFVQPAEAVRHTAAGWFVDDVQFCYAARPEAVSKITVHPASGDEGHFGTTALDFDIAVWPDPATQPVEDRRRKIVAFKTVPLDGQRAATADIDFVSTESQIIIPPDAASSQIRVLMIGDDLREPDEVFGLELSNVSSNVFLAANHTTGTILNDDAPSTFDLYVRGSSPRSTTVMENVGTATFQVEIVPPRTVPVDVHYATVDGTALGGTGLDYLPASGTLHFPANTPSQAITVTILNDSNYEDPDDVPPRDNEVFSVKFTSASPFAQGSTVDVAIQDDDAEPLPGEEPVAMNIRLIAHPDQKIDLPEGSCPFVSAADPCETLYDAQFVVTVSKANGLHDTLVDYKTVDDTAVAGEDYQAAVGTLTIPAGETRGLIRVPVWADRKIEDDETFAVVLSNPAVVDDSQSQVNIVTNRQVCTIRNDDYEATAFGAHGTVFSRRTLGEHDAVDKVLIGGPVDFSAATFRGYEFDTLYGWSSNKLMKINLATGEVAEIASKPLAFGEEWSGLAWDHANGRAYACNTEGDLVEIDLATGDTSPVAGGGGNLACLAVHPSSGRIYAVEVSGGAAYLYKVTPGDWTFQLITVLTGLTPGSGGRDPMWDCDFDSVTGDLYVTAFVGAGGDAAGSAAAAVEAGAHALSARSNADMALAYAAQAAANAPLYLFLDDCLSTVTHTIRASDDTILAAEQTLAAADLAANAAVDTTAARAAADTALEAAQTAWNAAYKAYNALYDAYWFMFFGWGSSFVLPAVAAADASAQAADAAATAAEEAAAEAAAVANAALGTESWSTRIVDIETGGTQVELTDPPFTSLAIATSPPPSAVRWTSDLYYPSARPAGVQLVADPDTLTNGDAGAVVSGVGDVNGDSFEDFVVTAKDATVQTESDDLPGAGKVFLFYGSPAAGYPDRLAAAVHNDVTFSESSVAGDAGLVIFGSAANEHLGVSASGAGDLDGDGLADFVLGAQGADSEGAAYLVFGSATLPGVFTSADIGATSLGAAVSGVRIYGGDLGDRVAASVAGAGDFNGDSLDDFLVGAPGWGVGSADGPGACYVIFGSTYGIGSNGTLSVQSLSPPRGIRILGENAGDQFGYSVSGAGDVNGDGVEDIAVGAPGAGSGDGAVIFVFGHVDYAKKTAPSPIDLARLSDEDPNASPPQNNPTLFLTVVMPEPGKLADTVNPPITYPENQAKLSGALPGMRLSGEGGACGTAVAGPGDMNGDSIDEVLMSAPGFDGSSLDEPHWGRVYLLLGSEDHQPEMEAVDVGGTIPGLLLTGVDEADQMGLRVAAAGDIDGNGYMDALISAAGATPAGFEGEVYAVLGRVGLGGILSLRDLAKGHPDVRRGLYFYNTQEPVDFRFGRDVAAAGDFNNDGLADVLVGRLGGAYVLFGHVEAASARYLTRMGPGADPLSDVSQGGGADLAKEVMKGVGQIGDRRAATPSSRVRIMFKGGGVGGSVAEASTQSVTLFRMAAPDLDVGEGSPEDDARWTPGNVYWKVETNREQFSKSMLEFHYRPEEVAGFDMQKVGVFYAKPNARPTEHTTWSWLPFVHDPDRRVFTVSRNHEDDKAQLELNGYYALIQADLVTYLGGVIPAVGVTNENVYQYGPEATPDGLAFWHERDKKLYAIHEGELTIKWKNTLGEVVSEVRAVNLWPRDESGLYQDFVAGSPGVTLEEPNSPYEFKNIQLTCSEDGLILPSDGITDNVFSADLPDDRPADFTARAAIMLSTSEAPAQGDLFFQFVRVVKWANPSRLVPSMEGLAWDVGRIISADTDPLYNTFHDEAAGGPLVYFDKAPYALASTRYGGYYDRTTREGSIVPVNTVKPDGAPMVVVYYQKGGRLIEANTGNPVRDPTTRALVPHFDWPYKPAKYAPQWPANAQRIVIARQDGSGLIEPAVYGSELDVYWQNDPELGGFNPNEEHALIRPYGTGRAVFALRNDLNGYDNASEPYVLMTYQDPNDLDSEGNPRAKMHVFHVVTTEGIYVFGPWAGVAKAQNPYMGDVGAFIQPPYPLSTLEYSPRNTSPDIGLPGQPIGKVFEDRTLHHWAKSAGVLTMKYFYPPQEGFYLPEGYQIKLQSVAQTGPGGDHIPWLDGGPDTAVADPIDVLYSVDWPQDVPTMRVGEILIEAKFGLPQINGQCSVDLVYQESVDNGGGPSARLIEPVMMRSVSLASLDPAIRTEFRGGELGFPDLPPSLALRLTYDDINQELKLKGFLVSPVLGFDYVLLNVIDENDKVLLDALSTNPSWRQAIQQLYELAREPIEIVLPDAVAPGAITSAQAENLALTTGDARGVGYVTLAMQNADTCSPLPVSLEIIKVVPDLEPGSIAVITPNCVFEEKLTLRHTNDFGGHPERYSFEWLYLPDVDGTIPPDPDEAGPGTWKAPSTGSLVSGPGVNEITIEGPGLLTLTDNWFVVRYRSDNPDLPWHDVWSDWTPVQFAEGWIKRVVGEINPFTQRASGGGIQGAENMFSSFEEDAPNRLVSMISQAGPRWTGDLPLNCENLDDFGLIPIYETVLGRGMDLSINALSPVDDPGVNTALLLVASRVSDLYMLLGNEAYADAADPTIAFGTDDGVYGSEATSIHCFMNQTGYLLEEELGLLRGRDNTYAPGTQLYPLYNRLIWNFTNDMTGGEVAYALNYNIKDQVEGGDGRIDEVDAKRLYPQGHGDAWGHYLTALTAYYKLLAHPFYTWIPRSEGVLVGGQAVTVDYLDERKFARAAAGKARAGAETVNLTYRASYTEDPAKQWQGYRDTDPERAWGFAEWASRAGQGAYIDWVVGNALIPAKDTDPNHTGIQKIDRTTVHDLREIASAYQSIQQQADMADLGLNPLGLGANVTPFDIDPSLVDQGVTHFEQIYGRAVTALNNAVSVFNHANNSTQLLRRQADSHEQFERNVYQTELDYKSRLIEIFGYPYDDDIGPGGTYPSDYDGPDLYHYMYTEECGLYRDRQLQDVYFSVSGEGADPDRDIPSIADGIVADNFPEISIGEGDLTFQVNVVNYLGVDRQYAFPTIPPADINLGDVINPFGSSASDGYQPFDPFAGLGQTPSDVLPNQSITVQYNMSTSGGRFGLKKPASWTGQRRAPGEIQLAQSDLNQQLGRFMSAVDDYDAFVAGIRDQIDLVEAQYGVSAHQLFLLNRRLDKKEMVQNTVATIEAVLTGLRTVEKIITEIASATAETVPTVTGVIVGFSNGVIVDGLAPVRGGMKIAGSAASTALRVAEDINNLYKLRLEQLGQRSDDQLTIDITQLQGRFANLQAIMQLEAMLRNEIPLRVALHTQHEAVVQAGGRYLKALAAGQRLMDELTTFRRQTAASVQTQRYKDMAFRVFRNDALQKYRAQYDLAARYVYLAAKAYDYETTMLSSDPMAGQQFLSDIVRDRLLGIVQDGVPQTGTGLADAMAVMERNFGVLKGQLGFNNPQKETNRFSLRHELFRILPGPEGNQAWRTVLSQDYFANGAGRVGNLFDVPEFIRYCVPPAGFGTVEPGIVIPFATTIEEGKNFFDRDIGGLDSTYDATQFATKIRSAGIWFSNYDYLNLSNTPRVYLVPAGTDVLRSPTGYTGRLREFDVLDQVLPVPFPISASELDNPSWIPSVDTLSGHLTAIRRFGRIRAYHDSGEFNVSEVVRDSRLVGRSVWNKKWMLIIPASTLSSDRVEGLERFIYGKLVNGERDGNGVSDIKLFFETYAYPRLKAAQTTKGAAE